MMGTDKIAEAIKEAGTSLGRMLSRSLSATDRQRITIRSTTVLFAGPLVSTEWLLLYEANENTRTEITEYLFSNIEASDRSLEIAIVPKGQNVSDDWIVMPAIEIPAKEHIREPANTAMHGGWQIYARTSQPYRINCYISGTEQVN